MRTLKLTLAYDGTDYCGWQVQPGQRTIQAEVERAILEITREDIRIAASGRTDSGVHAFGQVISFSTANQLPADAMQRALNAKLPDDVRILQAEEVAVDFHALRSAERKRYRYVLDNGRVADLFARRFAWHVPVPLDVEAMREAAQSLIGRHDFKSFESKGAERESSVRTVFDLSIEPGQGKHAEKVILEIEADGFLYNMVRAITGTLVEVGRGGKSATWPAEVLVAKDRNLAGQTAPPQGLTLLWVRYE